jgi:hypothetical protein
MTRDGLAVESSALWEQTWFLSQHLMATYEANHSGVLASDVIAVDETWWRLMKESPSKRWWVWSVAREDAASYRLLPSRSTDAARQVLAGYAGVAIGRKSHYGSRPERGTRVAALFYSLIESAKLAGVEPRGYLREANLRAVGNPGAVTLARDLKSQKAWEESGD